MTESIDDRSLVNKLLTVDRLIFKGDSRFYEILMIESKTSPDRLVSIVTRHGNARAAKVGGTITDFKTMANSTAAGKYFGKVLASKSQEYGYSGERSHLAEPYDFLQMAGYIHKAKTDRKFLSEFDRLMGGAKTSAGKLMREKAVEQVVEKIEEDDFVMPIIPKVTRSAKAGKW